MRGTKLTVCMIVKNEERFLEDCLKSVQPVASQIVVVDTGSTDRTVEIARNFGAEVHHFDWCDDFAAARNASLKYARGDWILWLDADERLEPQSIPLLKKLLRPEKKAVAYRVNIKSVLPDGKSFKLSTGHRLFTNRKNVYFEGRVHEQVIFSVARQNGEERISDVLLFHLGYGLDQQAQQKKNERNRRLLLKMVEENPDNGYAHFTLGQNYNLTCEYQKALDHYLKALNNNRFPLSLKVQLLNTTSEAYLKLNDLEQAEKFARQSVKQQPNQVAAYYILYRIARSQQKPAEALERLEDLLQMNQKAQRNPSQFVNDVLLSDADILFTRAELFYELGQIEEAHAVLQQAFAIEKDEMSFRRAVQFWLNKEEWAHAENLLLNPPQPFSNDLLNWLGVVQIKQQKFVEAIQTYTRLFQNNPGDLEIVKRLAGLFMKIGEPEKARSLMEMVEELQRARMPVMN